MAVLLQNGVEIKTVGSEKWIKPLGIGTSCCTNMRSYPGYGVKGRGLFATKEFKNGDVIFEEKPLVCCQFLWNEFYKYKACEFCLKSLECAEEMSRRLTNNNLLHLPYSQLDEVTKENHVVCPHCQITYCSSQCRHLAWVQYHKTLCMGQSREDKTHPLFLLQDAWRNMHYPPETSSIMLIAKMIAFVRQANNRDAVMEAFSHFTHSSVNEEQQIAHKLLGDHFQGQIEMLRSLLLQALFDEDIQQWFTQDGFRSLLTLVGRNGQGIGTSSISVWEKNCDKLELPAEDRKQLDAYIDQLYMDLDRESGTFLNCEGSGLYSLQTICNHGCVPNAEIQFPYNDHTLVLVAVENISSGEEICISYLDECERERSRYSRQKMLSENYLFTCQCVKCLSQAEEPDLTSTDGSSGTDDEMEDEAT